jgi:hypothetical protein
VLLEHRPLLAFLQLQASLLQMISRIVANVTAVVYVTTIAGVRLLQASLLLMVFMLC